MKRETNKKEIKKRDINYVYKYTYSLTVLRGLVEGKGRLSAYCIINIIVHVVRI